MLDNQALLYAALSNAVILGSKLMGGNNDLSQYVDQIVSLCPLIDDSHFQDVIDGYADNQVVLNYNSVVDTTAPHIKRYWSNTYFKMLVAGFALGGDGLQFDTCTGWKVKLYYNNCIVAISYFDPVTREYLSGDIYELDLQYALREVVERVEWLSFGHHPSVFPVKTKTNTFSQLKEVKNV